MNVLVKPTTTIPVTSALLPDHLPQAFDRVRCVSSPEISAMRIFITGATSGIGRAAALLYARRGDASTRLVLTGRRQALLDEVCAEANASGTGARAMGLTLDVSDREAMLNVEKLLPAEFAEPSVLVNNAGLALGVEPIHEGDVDNWEKMIDVNCKGLLYATKALVPGMVARGRGHIVNIGSVAGNYALPGGNVYCGSKAFANHISLALRADLYGTGVRCTSIEPGNTETEFSVVRFGGDDAKAAKVYEGQTERVAMSGEDIAEVIHFVTVGLGRHVNVNRIELMPERQGFNGFAFDRS